MCPIDRGTAVIMQSSSLVTWRMNYNYNNDLCVRDTQVADSLSKKTQTECEQS